MTFHKICYCKYIKPENHILITGEKTKFEICETLCITTEYEGHLIFEQHKNTEEGQQSKSRNSNFYDRTVLKNYLAKT